VASPCNHNDSSWKSILDPRIEHTRCS
jgi:hypothetical protein